MTNAYTRKKEPEVNKQLIIDAAIEIGSSSQWQDVTFQAIADRVGLSKGGIIHHFRNKEALLDELVSQSFVELTQWIASYKEQQKVQDGAMGYLQFVIEKGKDAQYMKTMKIIFQSIQANPQYRQRWTEWFSEHILPSKAQNKWEINSTMAILIAEGLWYSENLGFSIVNEATKRKVLQHLSK